MRRGPRSIGPRRFLEHATSPVRALSARSESFGRLFRGGCQNSNRRARPKSPSTRNRCARASAMQPSVGARSGPATCRRWRCRARASADGRCSRARPRHRRGDPRATAARRWRRREGAPGDCSCGRPAHRTSRRVRRIGRRRQVRHRAPHLVRPEEHRAHAPRADRASRRRPRACGRGTRCARARRERQSTKLQHASAGAGPSAQHARQENLRGLRCVAVACSMQRQALFPTQI